MHKYDDQLRQKIESMGTVPPVFKFDASATWQKMEAQLQPPSTNKKKGFVWMYWAAASILLMMVALIMFGSNGYQPKEVIAGTVKEDKEQPKKTILPTTNANDNKITNHSKEQKIIAGNIKKQNSSIVAKDEQITIVDSSNKQQSSSPAVQANMLETAASTSSSIVAKPLVATAKKTRLKVIHINELDAPPPPVIAKLDSKKQLLEQDTDDASEPSKPFWQRKPKQVSPSSFTDNQ